MIFIPAKPTISQEIFLATKKPANMPVYNKRGILLLPKVIVLNPKDGNKAFWEFKN